MKKLIILCLLLSSSGYLTAQQVFTLDSCRAMAIHNNKQLQIAGEKIKVAGYNKKSAFTSYLPNIDVTGAYLYNEKSLSLLSEDALLPTKSFDLATQSYQYNVVKGPDGKPVIGPNGKPIPSTVALIPKEAFEFDIRNTFVGMVSLTQPIFTGGKIRAYNQITKYAENLAKSQHETAVKELIFKTDEVYWQVVSLVYKKQLAQSYVALLDSLNNNVQAMIGEGVATQSDGLTVAVKQNEAQITLTKVENGLSLTKMVLAQICGLPLDLDFVLDDQQNKPEAKPEVKTISIDEVFANRSEIHSLQYASKIYQKKINVARSAMYPQLALTGNYLISNPSAFNGYRNKFDGMFNVGVMVKIPILHWGDNFYKINAAKAESRIISLQLEEAKENIELQVNQAEFRLNEAAKKLKMTDKNMEKANENLRNAQIGFQEGVLTANNVLEAQTAWLQAHSEHIDAQIDMQLSNVYLSKATGRMDIEK